MASFSVTSAVNFPIPPDDATSGASLLTLNVVGLQSPITSVAVQLTGLSHGFTGDLDFLLVGPDGTSNLSFLSDVGGAAPITDVDLVTGG